MYESNHVMLQLIQEDAGIRIGNEWKIVNGNKVSLIKRIFGRKH